MPSVTERRGSRLHRMIIHAVLIAGGVFLLLPLIWMIATSLKPLDQTLETPTDLKTAFLATGHRATIDGVEYEVSLHRRIDTSGTAQVAVVRSLEPFPAGELSLTFRQEDWRDNPAFSTAERAEMNRVVPAGTKLLADDRNRYDREAGLLHLRSGRTVRAELVRDITADDGEQLYVVREWRPSDTDTRAVGIHWDPSRAWDVMSASAVSEVIRPIPENYPTALRQVGFARSLLNTVFLCVMSVGGAVVSSVLVAYGFAFIPFRGRSVLFALTLATIMIPFVVVMVPVYLLYRELGWVGTFKPLWVHWWFGNAFFIFLLRQFFLGLPRDLLAAARIDGCGELEILWHIVVPLSRPAIAIVALFTFLTVWKDFLGPLIYLSDESQFTLSLALQSFQSQHAGTPWHVLMAASTVFSLPLIIVFFMAMKTFIRGVAMTGMKG
ncbi:MAG: carbohydrate ABC transporter permease [Phycisphaerae bacterium]